MARPEISGRREQINLSLLDEELPAGDRLRVLGVNRVFDRPTALSMADLAPAYNWAHPCRIYLHDAATGEVYDSVEASFPPIQMKRQSLPVERFHSPVALLDGPVRPVRIPSEGPPTINALANHPGRRFAILFSGDSDNRHLNDMEFLYRTLIDDYGFAAGDIEVCNHGGTVSYDGAPNPIGNWPGDNTAYRIVVNHVGRRAGFQAAIANIAARIGPGDLLLIHTNNHGGGPCDGFNDYFLCEQGTGGADWGAYMVNDFVADLGALPAFEVLLVMMEQCRSGGFINPILNNTPATWTHVVTAVHADDYSLGGANFDPFAEDWIAALAGQYPGGGALASNVDTNNDGRLSSAEVYAYALAERTLNGGLMQMCNGVALRLGDTPQSQCTPAGVDASIFLGQAAHDLFIRDNLQDHGREPLVDGGISASPDIILFNQELLDPDATLLTPAAQDNDHLSEPVERGQDNFIYLRVQNRGSQATSGTATVYWSMPSVLPTPGSWHLIGSVPIPAVPPGEMIAVGPIRWDKDDIPGLGHYCFVALVDSGGDAAPDKNAIQTVDQFYTFIRQSNNATWKNFDVVDVFANTITNMSFQVQGWPRVPLSAELQVDLTQLPPGFEGRLRILRRLCEGAQLEEMAVEVQNTMYRELRVNTGKLGRIVGMPLKPSDDTRVVLEITVPEGAADGLYRVSVAQVVDGRELGRVTQMLTVGSFAFIGNRRSGELHLPTCEWARQISPRNRVAYSSQERAQRHGLNGCRYCMPAIDQG